MRFPLFALLLVACAAVSDSRILPAQSDRLSFAAMANGTDEPEAEEAEATFAGGALEWRLKTLRNPDGRVPPDGLLRARAHMNRMRAAAQQRAAADPIQELSRDGWRWLGPGNIGGRVRSLVIHPTIPSRMFVGSVAGGIWRTENAGISWAPVDDFMANLAVSSLVINPRNPNIMYAGTGEAYYNYDALYGSGIFKSIDGGVTWSQLPATANGPLFYGVARLAMSADGNVLLAAGGGYFFRSVDGGATFTRSAQLIPIDIAFHPTDSRKAVGVTRSGAGYYTRDGGATWQTASGVPTSTYPGRLEVEYAPSQPDTVYLITADGALYVSNDGGVSYTPRSRQFGAVAQGWYNLTLWVNPFDASHLLFGETFLHESTDGGLNWRSIDTSSLHVDHHVIVAHPGFNNTTNRRVFVGNDGGVFETNQPSGGAYTWTPRNGNLGITQFYGAAGNATSGQIIGGTQDNGTLTYRPSAGTSWTRSVGGDGGFCAADPTDPRVMYGERQYLRLFRLVNGWPESIDSGIPEANTDNAPFIAPFILDPNDPSRMLAGGRTLWRTNDVKAPTPTWSAIKPQWGYISAIAIAQGNPDLVWVGYQGGDVYKTTNGTSANPTWTHMYSTSGSTFVTRITLDPTNSNIVYVSRGGFFAPGQIVRTEDGGATWSDATGTGTTSLPVAPVRDVEVDPLDPFIIYAATEVGIFVSRDRGVTWDLPQDGPANVSVDELFTMGTTIVAATHGRGLFALDRNVDGTQIVTLTPDRINFGVQTIGVDGQRRHVTVTNSGTASLTVQSVEMTANESAAFIADNIQCFGVTLAPGGSCGFDVRFFPQAEGQRSALILVSSTAPGSPHELPLTGVGSTSPTLPFPWVSEDIGYVGIAGRSSFANGTFTAEGAGADVWGTSDAFHFVYRTLTGDGEIVARVATIENTNAWTKMGVMFRATLDASSPHAFMLVSSGKGLAFQRRPTQGGISANTSGGAGTAPRWVRLRRTGNVVAAAVSADGTSWTPVGQDTISLPATAYVGLVAHSHTISQLATATFDSVAVNSITTPTLPSPWVSEDIGAVGTSGRVSYANGVFTLEGAGADVWGTADAFHFVHRTLDGDGEIVARVTSIENTHAWTKMGVMIRASLSASSAHAFMLVSSGKGLAFQRRTATGATSVNTSGGAGTAPYWVRLRRTGNVVTAAVSAGGGTWTTVGQDTIALPAIAHVGLVASSHDPAQLATGTFDVVTVRQAGAIPDGWQENDIGAVGAAGSAGYTDGIFTLRGAGADVWGTADAFHFVYGQSTRDNILISARVNSVENVHAWTKAGVMIRQSLTPGSPHAFVLVSPGKGTAFQRRLTAGATSSNTAGPAATAPYWVRLERRGTSFVASVSAGDGVWTTVGSATISMTGTVYVGLVVSSHDPARTAAAAFEWVGISIPP